VRKLKLDVYVQRKAEGYPRPAFYDKILIGGAGNFPATASPRLAPRDDLPPAKIARQAPGKSAAERAIKWAW